MHVTAMHCVDRQAAMLTLRFAIHENDLPPGAQKPMSRAMQTYRGSCHCGAVRFEIETDFPELTMCDCSICRRKNALMVKVHESKFRLLAGEESLTEYQFHTLTARHFFCKVCGIYPFHRKRVTPDNLGVNVFCLHDFDPAGIPVRQAVGAGMP